MKCNTFSEPHAGAELNDHSYFRNGGNVGNSGMLKISGMLRISEMSGQIQVSYLFGTITSS